MQKLLSEQLISTYGNSSCRDICLNLIADFEAINRTKYSTDLKEFIKESNYENFYRDEKESIFVSTVHKAKGWEFDSVYMLMNNVRINADEDRRKIYVGLTRAKSKLYIHL